MPYMVFFSDPSGENDVEEFTALAQAVRAIEEGVVGGRTFVRLIEIRDVPVGLDVTVRVPNGANRKAAATSPQKRESVVATPKPLRADADVRQRVPASPELDDAPIVVPEHPEMANAFSVRSPQNDFGIFGR